MEIELDWDDIHTGGKTDDATSKDVHTVEDDDIESRTFGTDDGLESGAVRDEDDDIVVAAADDAGKVEDVETSDMTGIELYLSQFDIVAGMIQFEDGSEKHFDELDPAEQADVLRTLHGNTASSVEEKYGLDQNEIGLINHLRNNNLTVDQMIEAEVNTRVAQLMTTQAASSVDFDSMDADTIYTKFLQESSPEATPEQLATDLAKAKEMSNFVKLTDSLRNQYKTSQKSSTQAAEAARIAEHNTLVEEQRTEIVGVVTAMTEYAGIQLNDSIKNSVLDRILQIDDDGDSAFMSEVFSEPENLFKAAFWFQYGEAILSQRDEYWKKEKSAAYKRGKEDALGTTTPGNKKTFISKQEDNGQDPHKRRPVQQKQANDEGDWSDLFDE